MDKKSEEWWKELKNLEKAKWCCDLSKQLEMWQCEDFNHVFHRLKFNYCPHCGRKIERGKP